MTKIATCCYCGTRAALVFKGRERHDLSCSNCGAPLYNLKKTTQPKDMVDPVTKTVQPIATNKTKEKPRKAEKRKKKRKKKKSFFYKLFKKIKDEIEDIFD